MRATLTASAFDIAWREGREWDLAQAVNRALAEIYRSGNIGSIYERWFGAFGKPSTAILSMYLLNGLPE